MEERKHLLGVGGFPLGGVVQGLGEVWIWLTWCLVLDLNPLSSTALACEVLHKW